MIHPDWVYEGTFLHDSLEGVGIKKYENGDVYKGYFHRGFEEGEGVLQKGEAYYSGNFHVGRRHGPFRVQDKDHTYYAIFTKDQEVK